ncbi:arginine decarboxylase [Methanophagales archaeon]|nr:arginine decarboxylase [Methanophagales archaeon]
MNERKIETLIPREFFVTSGVGMDSEQAAAFDFALFDAGIGECNLVGVSSILPAKAVETERSKVILTPGEITFCVMSRADGESGEVIGAGIGYGRKVEENGSGIVCEHHGHHSETYLTEKLREKLYKMAEIRAKEIVVKGLKAKSVKVEEGQFGSVVVALVFVF